MTDAPVLLNQASIQHQLALLDFTETYQLHCLETIDSTNRFVRDEPDTTYPIFCCAEAQTAGRGRLQRQWFSPYAENIYFSGRWTIGNQKTTNLSGLSLVVGLTVIDMLKSVLGIETIQLKWPNDLLWQQQKLCGILIEFNTQKQQMIVGIGLNVNRSNKIVSPVDQAWCSLLDMTGQETDRNDLLAHLIVSLDHKLQLFFQSGFTLFHDEWDKVDALKDQWVSITQPNGTLSGYARGVTVEGLLRLEDKNQQIVSVSVGDVS